MAPEVFRNEEYDTKVDVFSFALILQEVQLLFTVSGLTFYFKKKSLEKSKKVSLLYILLLPHNYLVHFSMYILVM